MTSSNLIPATILKRKAVVYVVRPEERLSD